MQTEKVTFTTDEGIQLSARLELPIDQHPHAYALFAHCFTCNKNLSAVRNISRALARQGFGVLRFDFTGLGESEGDFADTNFSSNIQDLLSAARFLGTDYESPSLLIGHSLGGAAVLRAAYELESVKAVATIGAPFDPEHVKHLFGESQKEIEESGVAKVHIGGRSFTVKKQFLEDIEANKLSDRIASLDRALLIMHSPQDLIVAVENAADIYMAARHPKSFISLDGADHLLSRKADSQYAGHMIAAWTERYLPRPSKDTLQAEKEVSVRLNAEDDFTTDIMIRKHGLVADEPESVGGHDFGPTPYDLVSAGLGACTAMTLHMYARRKKWPLDSVKVHIDHYKDYAQDQQECADEKPAQIDHFERVLEIEGDLSEKQLERLLEIADRCPVHRTLHNPVDIRSVLKGLEGE
jgi:uncharacterized OsmC-like protein/esterase/lipase